MRQKILGLTGSEKILDIACGYGRHSLELARRGFEVVGVDSTKAYIEDAKETAQKEKIISASYIQSDLRELTYENEFDVVLNLADGAIGYLENEEENNKVFDIISKALKKRWKTFYGYWKCRLC